jgi:hypothetical protein
VAIAITDILCLLSLALDMFDLAREFPRKGEVYARRRDEACTPEEEKNWGPRRRCEATGIVRREPRKLLAGVIGAPLIVSDAIFYNPISLCFSASELIRSSVLGAKKITQSLRLIVGYLRAAIYLRRGKGLLRKK